MVDAREHSGGGKQPGSNRTRLRSFAGVPCIVVGATKGIGLALARQLVGKGADVALIARGLHGLESTRAALEQTRTGPQQIISCHQADVIQPQSALEALQEAMRCLGRSPALVLICSGSALAGAFEDLSLETAQQVMASNFYGIWNVTHAVLPAMRKEGGVIVATASVAGLIGTYGYTAYSAAKFAVIGFAESLRTELTGSGVRLSVLCPPDTDTPGLAEERKTRPAETEALAESSGILSADEVAAYTLEKLKSDEFLIIPGAMARLSCLAKRLAPGIVFAQMDSTVRKVQRAAPKADASNERLGSNPFSRE